GTGRAGDVHTWRPAVSRLRFPAYVADGGVAMAITYNVGVDRDDNGDFDDITADVLALRWRLGMRAAHDSMAEPGNAQSTVGNVDQSYSPEVHTLQPRQVVRIQSDGSSIGTHVTGHIAHIEPQPGNQGRRAAVIHAADAIWQLQQHTVRLPPQVTVRAGAVIEQILDRVPFRRPKLRGYGGLCQA